MSLESQDINTACSAHGKTLTTCFLMCLALASKAGNCLDRHFVTLLPVNPTGQADPTSEKLTHMLIMQLQPIASKLERLADVLETREQIVSKLDHLTSDMQDVSSKNQEMTVENSKLKSELGTSHQQVGGSQFQDRLCFVLQK